MQCQTTVVPPGFAALAADSELAAQLGPTLFGVLLRLCHLAEPAADIPGGWCTALGSDALAAELGTTRKTSAKWLRDLSAAGLIARVDGRALGRGLGGTPTRYFITAIAGLTIPPITPGKISRGKESRGTISLGKPSPLSELRASRAPALVREDSPSPVVDVSQDTQHTARTPAPSWLQAAKKRIGYVGELPATDLDDTTMLRVIERVEATSGITSKPRYLNWLLRSGLDAIESFLAESTPTDTDIPLMDLDDYLTQRSAFPQWAAAVQAQADADAREAGATVDLRWILAAAARIPVGAKGAAG